MERGFDRQDIGDVNSEARGSGARFNTGKVRLDYVPARVIHSLYSCGEVPLGAALATARLILDRVAAFEERDGDEREHLVAALDFSLRPVGVVDRWRDVCDVFDFGAKKYAAWNWAKGMQWSVPLACIKRHCVKILEGERDDDESGLSHFGHIGCNLVMLLHYLDNYAEGDDRPSRECFAQDETPEPTERLVRALRGAQSVRGVIETELPELIRPSLRGAFDPALLDVQTETIISPETGDSAEVDSFCTPNFPCWVCRGAGLCPPAAPPTVKRCNDPGCLCHRTTY